MVTAPVKVAPANLAQVPNCVCIAEVTPLKYSISVGETPLNVYVLGVRVIFPLRVLAPVNFVQLPN